jgi:hypothetical protein
MGNRTTAPQPPNGITSSQSRSPRRVNAVDRPTGSEGSNRPSPFPVQGRTVNPWLRIFGDGQRSLASQTHDRGEGLVVLLGPIDSLILDTPDRSTGPGQ